MTPARSRRSASHAAGTHDRFPKKTGWPGLRRGGIGRYNLHSPPDCGTPTTYRMYPFGAGLPPSSWCCVCVSCNSTSCPVLHQSTLAYQCSPGYLFNFLEAADRSTKAVPVIMPSSFLWNRRVLHWFQYGDNHGLSAYGRDLILHEAYVEHCEQHHGN